MRLEWNISRTVILFIIFPRVFSALLRYRRRLNQTPDGGFRVFKTAFAALIRVKHPTRRYAGNLVWRKQAFPQMRPHLKRFNPKREWKVCLNRIPRGAEEMETNSL